MSITIRCRNYDLLTGLFIHPSGVLFRYDPRNTLSLDESATAEKKTVIDRLVQAGKKVEILPLYRFLSLEESMGGIVFDLGHTDFGEYLLTDITHPEWNGTRGSASMAHPLSVSAVTFSSDNCLILGERGTRVANEPGKIQTIPGGYIHPPDSVMETMEKELEEELAIAKHEIGELMVTGVAQVQPSGKPEILLLARLNVSSSEIVGRCGTDRWEFTRLGTIPGSRESITGFLRTRGDRLAPASHAALASFAIHAFGIGAVSECIR
jgi:8-oxo-dGTP pyrophosphatase MutT (NUDIX family)